jgi:hypothetical protein
LPAGTGILTSVVYGGGKFVAVGPAGSLITSQDGRSWTRHPGGPDAFDICWNGQLFVAVGEDGGVFASADGIAWVDLTSPVAVDLVEVDWGSGRFIAVSKNDSVLTSSNGVDWYATSTGLPDSFFNDVVWDGARFLAVGYANAGGQEDTAVVMSSNNGTSWSLVRRLDLGWFESDTFIAVDWTGSEYVAAGTSGAVVSSPDAQSWNVDLRTGSIVMIDVEMEGGGGVALGYIPVGIFSSIDGVNWVEDPLPLATDGLQLVEVELTANVDIIVGGRNGEGVVLLRNRSGP